MELVYNNIDITKDISILNATILDNSGGKADSVDLTFSDTKKLWRKWGVQKGDTLILSKDGFSSGLMYVDDFNMSRGKFTIRGISVPLKSKSNISKSWENIRFKELASQLASELGLTLETYGIIDYTYDRLDMINKTNLQYLNDICILEGYSLKITNNKAIIYDENLFEQSTTVDDITEDRIIGDYSFNTISNSLYSSCTVECFSSNNNLIRYKFSPANAPIGSDLKVALRVVNQGEAERYARGLLRNSNKNETTGSFFIKLNTNIAATNTVNLNGFGVFDGKYFIDSIKHKLTNGKSHLKVRKVLEGY